MIGKRLSVAGQRPRKEFVESDKPACLPLRLGTHQSFAKRMLPSPNELIEIGIGNRHGMEAQSHSELRPLRDLDVEMKRFSSRRRAILTHA